MAQLKLVFEELQQLWDTGTTLAVAARKAADYDGAANPPDGALFADLFLTYSTDTAALTAGDVVGEMYMIPSNSAATPIYATGGDGSVGGDFTPQGIFFVGTFVAVNPGVDGSTEVLGIGGVPLYEGDMRFVFVNTRGKTISLEWELNMKVYRHEIV